jgi:hypothetical protein
MGLGVSYQSGDIMPGEECVREDFWWGKAVVG